MRRMVVLVVVAGAGMTTALGVFSASGSATEEDASAAAALRGKLVRVLSPKHAWFAPSRDVRIRVRTNRGVRRFSAEIDDRSITRRFGRPVDGVRTARLRLRRGVHYLSVDVAGRRLRDFARVRFVVARRSPRYLVVRHARRGSHLIVKSRTLSPAHRFEARLNGRRVGGSFVKRGARRIARLDGDHGLRFGRNRLTVAALHNRGRYDREAHSEVVVTRRHPLVGAGPARRTTTGDSVSLDGRASRAARRGGRLRYRWRIARRPRGSRARLRGAHRVRPSLSPDKPGRYRIELAVRELGRAGAQASASAVVRDTTTVVGEADVPPLGTPIDTIPAGKNGIQLGDQFVPAGTGVGLPWVQMMVLERDSLKVIPPREILPQSATNGAWVDERQITFPCCYSAQNGRAFARPLDAVKHTTSAHLVILTGGHRNAPIGEKSTYDELVSALKELGGTDRTLLPFRQSGTSQNRQVEIDPAVANGDWSLIGSRKSPEGQAAQNTGLSHGAALRPGSLAGFVSKNARDKFGFVAGNYVDYDTSDKTRLVPAGKAQNFVRIGSESYASELLPQGLPAFHLVVLDQGSLKLRTNRTFIVGGPQGQNGQRAFAQALNDSKRDCLVIVQSIGSPASTSRAWTGAVTPALLRVGASFHVVNGLAGKGSYALVGGTDTGRQGTEASQELLGADKRVRLSGVLARNDQSQFVPVQSALGDAVDLSLYELAFQEPTVWPESDTPGKRAANAWFAGQLGFTDQDDVRPNYWKVGNGSDPAYWTGRQNALRNLTYPGGTPGFSEDEFDKVKKQLYEEFGQVSDVRGLIAALGNLFFKDEVTDVVTLHEVAKEVENAADPPRGGGFTFDAFAFATGVMHFLTEAISIGGGFTPEGEAVRAGGEAMGALSSFVELASETATDRTSGLPFKERLQGKEEELEDDVRKRFLAYWDEAAHLGDIIVSDHEKLKTVAFNFSNKWSLPTDRENGIREGLALSARRSFYSALMPLKWKVYTLEENEPGGNRNVPYQKYLCPGTSEAAPYPFKDAPRSSAHYGLSHYDRHGPVYRSVLLSTSIDTSPGQYGERLTPSTVVRTPPAKLTDKIFGPLAAGGNVGLHPQTFYAQNFDRRNLKCDLG